MTLANEGICDSLTFNWAENLEPTGVLTDKLRIDGSKLELEKDIDFKIIEISNEKTIINEIKNLNN